MPDTQPGEYSYWDSYPDFPVEDWQAEVANGDTREGYWDWASSKLVDNGGQLPILGDRPQRVDS